MRSARSSRVTGVDGCRDGWAGVDCDGDGIIGVRLAPSLGELLHGTAEDQVVGIDMPLGLLATGWRAADREVRALLGPRRSSIFAIPPAPVWQAATYADANRLCRRLTGNGFSAQAWGLRRKLLEAAEYRLQCRHPLYEVHPELSFGAIAGAPLPHPKRTAAGHALRRGLLAGPAWRSLTMRPPRGPRPTYWTRRPSRGPPGGSRPARHTSSPTRRRPTLPAARSRSATSVRPGVSALAVVS